jgi:outer membrane protein
MNKLKFILFAGLILVAQNHFAQEVLTLDECINYALRNNIQLKQTELNVDRAQVNKERAVADFLPTVNGGAGYGVNYGRRIDPFTNQFATNSVQTANLFASSSLTLFSGLTKVHTHKQSKYNWLASLEDVNGAKNNLRLNITTAYLNVLFARELLLIAENQLEITTQQVGRTNQLVDAGQLPRASLYDLESQMASEELSVVNAENDLILAKVSLIQLLQMEGVGADDIVIAAPELDMLQPQSLVIGPDEVYNAAISLMPEIQSAQYRIESAKAGLSAARGRHSPTLSFGAQIGTGYSGLNFIQSVAGFEQIPIGQVVSTGETVVTLQPQPLFVNEGVKPYRDQFSENFNRNLALNLTIPIFNGWQVRTGVRQAQIDLESSKLSLEENKNALYQDIRRAHADAIASYKQYFASQKAVEALQENFQYAEARFEQKAINAVEFFDTKTRLTNAESNLAQAKFNYLFRTKILDFYQGKPISLDQ